MTRRQAVRGALAALAVVAILAAAGWVATAPQRVPAASLPPHTPNLDNGRTLFFAGGCASCHATPGADEPTRLGGGLKLSSPFGTFVVPNISPHGQDGIGTWSEADFASAMLKGTSPDGRHYYPAFPYGSYQRMPLADVRDLFAYLKTLPPTPGRPGGHALGFPYSVRAGVGLWKWLYLDGAPFAPDAGRSAAWNRGAYLVNGPGHCAECHSPRTWLGGIEEEKRFAGGPNPEGRGWVPNITQHGLGTWSEAEIVELLTSGFTPEFDSVGGQMARVAQHQPIAAERPRRHRGLSQDAAGGGRAATAAAVGITPPAPAGQGRSRRRPRRC